MKIVALKYLGVPWEITSVLSSIKLVHQPQKHENDYTKESHYTKQLNFNGILSRCQFFCSYFRGYSNNTQEILILHGQIMVCTSYMQRMPLCTS